MSEKQEKSGPSGSKKLLNKKAMLTAPTASNMTTSVPLSPPKSRHSINIGDTTISPLSKKNNMDHYVLQTIKHENDNEEGTIDFVLRDDAECNVGRPSGEITEELHLSGEDGESDCGKTEEIVEHMCGKCYKTFRRFSGLKKHLDFCRFDSGYHLRKAQMMKNLEKIEKDAITMENKDICFCCNESYDTFHLGHINCPDCPKSFKTQMSYERHIFITHSENDDYPCTICNAKLRSANLLKLHMEQHQNRGKPYACKICGKDFTRSYHLKRHQKYSSCAGNIGNSMNCKVCNRVFFRLDNLRAHLKQHLGTHVTKKPEYMCPICKNCFYSLSTLNIHTRTHTGERPFDCDLCVKKFPSLVALKKHRRYHTGEKPYTCEVCNQAFAVKEVLNRHMKRHTGERPHVCSECGKSFIQATQLRSHSKTHVKPFECEECKDKFKTEKQLERHVKCHYKGRKRRTAYKCALCKAVFKREEHLKEHMEHGSHTIPPKRKARKERTDCAICDKNFDTVKNLNFHILKVHEVDPEDFVNERVITKSEDDAANRVQILSDTPVESISVQKTDAGGVVVQEFIVNELPSTSGRETIFLENEAFTVIPLESDGGAIETITSSAFPEQIITAVKKVQKKTLAESLAAAIADDDSLMEIQTEEDLKFKENVGKLLDMLVDNVTLKKFGWPQTSEEVVLCKVIENCGHDLSKDEQNYKCSDYVTRMREYVKLLFTVVIHNDSIKELLNNYSIDEVIEYVLGNGDSDESSDAEHEEIVS